MSRANPPILFGFFVAIIVAICGVSLAKQGLYLARHEGDLLHFLDIVMRMVQGQRPHLDFMTPIGALAFAPVVVFVKAGFGVGVAFILAQAALAVLLLPAVWWVGVSRMRGVAPYLFGLVVFVLVLALLHGEASGGVSVSMHYNRWAWAVSFVAIALAVFPSGSRERPVWEGLILGLALFALAMTKVTYVAAFLVPIVVGLLVHGRVRTLAVAVVVGLIGVALVTAWMGPEYWAAYLNDVLTVAGSDIRPAPGEGFGAVLGAPAYVAGSLIVLLGVILLRQAGDDRGGLLLLLLAPGFFYVTYQNFGNDPQWLMLLSVLLLAFKPEVGLRNGMGWDMGGALKVTSAVAFALIVPSFLNLAYSPFRHLSLPTEYYVPLTGVYPQLADVHVHRIRAFRENASVPIDGPGSGLEQFAEQAERSAPSVWKGEVFPDCEIDTGMIGWFQAVSADLEVSMLVAGHSIFAADFLSSEWLFGPFAPVASGAPWYYGGVASMQKADFVLVPLCAISPQVRQRALSAIAEAGIKLVEVRRTPLYVLFARNQTP